MEQENNLTASLVHFNPTNNDAKSLYLNLISEQGIVGLALFMLIVIRFYRIQSIHKNSYRVESARMTKALGASITALMIAGLFDTPILQSYCVPSTFLTFLLLGVTSVGTSPSVSSLPVLDPIVKIVNRIFSNVTPSFCCKITRLIDR